MSHPATFYLGPYFVAPTLTTTLGVSSRLDLAAIDAEIRQSLYCVRRNMHDDVWLPWDQKSYFLRFNPYDTGMGRSSLIATDIETAMADFKDEHAMLSLYIQKTYGVQLEIDYGAVPYFLDDDGD